MDRTAAPCFPAKVTPEGDSTDADVIVKASADTLLALLKRELSPIKAYTKGELKVKASFRDLLMLKKFF